VTFSLNLPVLEVLYLPMLTLAPRRAITGSSLPARNAASSSPLGRAKREPLSDAVKGRAATMPEEVAAVAAREEVPEPITSDQLPQLIY
jgi:hypothetical protein